MFYFSVRIVYLACWDYYNWFIPTKRIFTITIENTLLYVRLRLVKCTAQPIDKNTFGNIPSIIATLLNYQILFYTHAVVFVDHRPLCWRTQVQILQLWRINWEQMYYSKSSFSGVKQLHPNYQFNNPKWRCFQKIYPNYQFNKANWKCFWYDSKF